MRESGETRSGSEGGCEGGKKTLGMFIKQRTPPGKSRSHFKSHSPGVKGLIRFTYLLDISVIAKMAEFPASSRLTRRKSLGSLRADYLQDKLPPNYRRGRRDKFRRSSFAPRSQRGKSSRLECRVCVRCPLRSRKNRLLQSRVLPPLRARKVFFPRLGRRKLLHSSRRSRRFVSRRVAERL